MVMGQVHKADDSKWYVYFKISSSRVMGLHKYEGSCVDILSVQWLVIEQIILSVEANQVILSTQPSSSWFPTMTVLVK